MVKKFIEESIKKTIYECDLCGKQGEFGNFKGIHECTFCGKDVCESCGTYYDDNSDYPPFYCKEHYEKYMKYEKEANKKQEELDIELEQLYNKIMNE